MDCYWEMLKEMVLLRTAHGDTEQQAVRKVWEQMFDGPMTIEIQEAMYVAMQSCKDQFTEFSAEYQRLGKEFQDATMEGA